MLAGNSSDLPSVSACSEFGNLLLSRLGVHELELIRPDLERIELAAGDILHAADTAIDHVYFLETGLASLARPIAPAASVEIGHIGLEGMVGVCVALMADRTPFMCRMVLPGWGHRIRAAAFRSALAQTGDLFGTILLYAQAMIVQLAETAASNAKQALDARVARWLLMCQDRVGRDEINVTHATIAGNLAVRRAGVTDALHVLEGERAIRSLRGRIVILDRSRLEAAANGSYGLAEAEYRRLFTAPDDTAAAMA